MVLRKILALALVVILAHPQPLLALSLIGTVKTNAEHTYAVWNSKSKLLAVGLYWRSVLVGKYYSELAIVSSNGSVVWVSGKIKGFIHPLWSNDGRLLAFRVEDSFENYDIAVYDVVKGKIIGKFSAKSYENVGPISWSPKGNQITFPIHNIARESVRIVSYNPDFTDRMWESREIENTSITWVSWNNRGNNVASLALTFSKQTFTVAGKVIMLNGSGGILWENKLFEIAPEEPHILVAKWDRNGELLAVLFVTPKVAEVRIYDGNGVLNGRYVIASNIGNVSYVSAVLDWSPNGSLSLAVSYSYININESLSKLAVMDSRGNIIWKTTFNSLISYLSWNPSGHILATTIQEPGGKYMLYFFNSEGQIVCKDNVDGFYISWLSNESLVISGLNQILFYSLKGGERGFEIDLEELAGENRIPYTQLLIALSLLAVFVLAVLIRRRK